MADFWQINSPLDFEDELEEVTEPVFERDDGLNISLAKMSKRSRKLLSRGAWNIRH